MPPIGTDLSRGMSQGTARSKRVVQMQLATHSDCNKQPNQVILALRRRITDYLVDSAKTGFLLE